MTDHQVILGDCLDELKKMADGSVDLVLCSPPYEAARTYGIGFKLAGQDWVDWAFARFMECYRVSRGLVVWVVEGQTRDYRWSAVPMLLAADLHRAGVKLRKPPIFHRVGIPGSGGPDWWRNDYEFCICATHGKLPWSDNTATGHPPKWAPGGALSNRHADGTRKNGRDKPETKAARVNQWGKTGSSTGTGYSNGKPTTRGTRPSHKETTQYDGVTKANPGNVIQETYTAAQVAELVNHALNETGNVIRCKVGGGHMGSDIAHENEAPFPEQLVEPYVLSFCPPDGTVLDCFGGSGTTASVAKQHNRNSISIDIRQSQVELIKRRLNTAQPQLF